MLKRSFIAAAFALAACGGSSGPATHFGATMNGASEVPATTSTATGTASYTVNVGGLADGGTSVNYVVTYTGLSGPPTASHIHVGSSSVAGGIVVPFKLPPALGASGSFDGSFDASNVGDGGTGVTPNDMDSFLAAMRAANTYTNIHTQTNKSGEIRGQNQPQ